MEWDLTPHVGQWAGAGRVLKISPPPFLPCQNEREETLTTNVWIEMVRALTSRQDTFAPQGGTPWRTATVTCTPFCGCPQLSLF